VTDFRDRVKELIRVPARQLVHHPDNPKHHGEEQRTLLGEILAEIGLIGAVVVRPLGDRYQLIDGHLRSEMLDQDIPCLVTDLTDDECDLALTTFDPVAQKAKIDAARVAILRGRITTAAQAIRSHLDALHSQGAVSAIRDLAGAARPRERAVTRDMNQYRTFSCVLNFDDDKRLHKALQEAKLAHDLQTTPQALMKIVEEWSSQHADRQKANGTG